MKTEKNTKTAKKNPQKDKKKDLPRKVVFLDNNDLEAVSDEMLEEGYKITDMPMNSVKSLAACIMQGHDLKIGQLVDNVFYSKAVQEFLSEPENKKMYVGLSKAKRKQNARLLKKKLSRK